MNFIAKPLSSRAREIFVHADQISADLFRLLIAYPLAEDAFVKCTLASHKHSLKIKFC